MTDQTGTGRAPLLVLNRAQVASLLDLGEVMHVVEQAHAALSTGTARQPDRSAMELPGGAGLLVPMVAAVDPLSSAGVKLLTDTPPNAGRGLPVQQSVITLIDPDTGTCEAVLNGAPITLLRTAAASAVATRHLARQGAGVLGLIGAGAQARAHLAALARVMDIGQVLVWSRTRATVEAFAEHARGQGYAVKVADDPEQVVRAAEVLCTLTPSRRPVVRGEWFGPGLHVNAVGAPPRPDHREIDTAGIVRSRVVVDSFSVSSHESGEVLIPMREGAITPEHFRTELGDVITGRAPGRRSADDITLYNSVGVGIQDVAAARLVVDAARRHGVGTEVHLS
ncbi:ornithine cyclodeaminase family protein [Streptomyces sp. NPDC087437]|uniref:ornithine cyclodeaminase family protein n=1 Tax=Streptomyces sp. NPDC087437 TaxID=3365789 RepID=UPI0038290426